MANLQRKTMKPLMQIKEVFSTREDGLWLGSSQGISNFLTLF